MTGSMVRDLHSVHDLWSCHVCLNISPHFSHRIMFVWFIRWFLQMMCRSEGIYVDEIWSGDGWLVV